MNNWESRALALCWGFNALVLIFIAILFFLIPAMIVVRELSDPNIRSVGIPRFAWKLHQSLTPRYEKWARNRLNSTRAAELPVGDISGTEWPLFGSVFYLWATESLQDAWEKNHRPSEPAPSVYAEGAIQAATRLVIDPKQANWVDSLGH